MFSIKTKEITPYTDINYLPLPVVNEQQAGGVFLSDLRTLNVGQGGSSVLRADSQGLWLGAERFNDAPLSLSMQGDIVANSFELTGGTIKYGKTSFDDDVHPGYFISGLGVYFGSEDDTTKLKYDIGTGLVDFVGTVSGLETSVLASAINAAGILVTDIINDKLDTQAQTILSEFTFGLSGAIQIGEYEAGVSGDIRVSPNGILGRNKDNEMTLALDATTGDATFGGTLVAAKGTLGEITSAEITGGTITGVIVTGGTIRTAASNKRIVISGTDNSLRMYDASNHQIFNLSDLSSILLDIQEYAENNTSIRIQNDSGVTFLGRLLEIGVQGSNSTGKAAFFSHAGLGDCVYMQATGGGKALVIDQSGDNNAVEINVDSNKPALFINYDSDTNSGAIDLDLNANSGVNCVGMKMDINNAGAGAEYAFHFEGSEFDGAKTSVSGLIGVVRIMTSEGAGFIPVYGSAS